MPLPSAAQLSALQDRIAGFLSARTGGPVTLRDLRPLYGGACQDNYRLEVELADLPGAPRRLVLRGDAESGISFTLSRREEFAVIRLALSQGVRTPRVRWLARDLCRPGAWSYFMDFVEGEALGGKVVRGAELAAARPALPGELAAELARIHRVSLAAAADFVEQDRDQALPAGEVLPPGLAGLRSPGPDGTVATELRCVEEMMARLREPHIALELAMGWLRDQANWPAVPEVVLVHGDFRTGNFLVSPAGLQAVLDWEFAHFGSPMEDLAWFCLRDWRFGQLRLPAGGLSTRAAFYAAYEKESGRRVDPRAVHYFEILGNVRWALGCIDQGERYLSHGEGDLELVAIARRSAEMEYEALRLIRHGLGGSI